MAVETIEWLSMLRRMIRRAGMRVAEGDEPELAALLALQTDLDRAKQAAVDGMRARGCSWSYIASASGTSKQAAQKRWGTYETEGG